MSLSAKALEKLSALAAAKATQTSDRNTLSSKLQAAANSVATRKALVALLPEFEKYLPADKEAACKNLPAVANLLADFSKAGWPKSATAKSTK
jgi:Tfp pilus assembly protein PilO